MSENGPREGTRDLPRPGAEAGRRSVDATGAAGAAYDSLSRALRRRRAELTLLSAAGGSSDEVARAYNADHPLEPPATAAEVDTIVNPAHRRPRQSPSRGPVARSLRP